MVSFDDRPTIHLVPFYRPSTYDMLFWKPEDLAEFRRDAPMLKEEEEEEDQLQSDNDEILNEQHQHQSLVEVQEKTTKQQEVEEVGNIRGYNRPDDWFSLPSAQRKMGYRIKTKIDTPREQHHNERSLEATAVAPLGNKIREYNRPDDWLPLNPPRGKIGYAKTIRTVWEVNQS